MKVLVVIKSCHKYAERRAAQRATWLPFLKVDRLHVLGDGPKVNEENILQLNVLDGFGNMAPKVRCACAWSVTHGYDWTFICDDDTYAVPLRFEAALPPDGIH